MSSLQAYRGPFDGVTHVQMHALSLLIALLEGGNSCVQRAIDDYFRSHSESEEATSLSKPQVARLMSS